MPTSRFWATMAIFAGTWAFFVGSGLGQETGVPLPSGNDIQSRSSYSAAPADGTVFSRPPSSLPSHHGMRSEPDPFLTSPVESTWYARIDYFHWNERYQGSDFVNESASLYTLGYSRRTGIQRFRFEAFAARADYEGANQSSGLPALGNTDYAGVRGEYDVLFEPDWSPRLTWFAGIGTRLWMRSIADMADSTGNATYGYNETWWTVYPYVGVETRRNLDIPFEWFASGRIGFTAYTYEYESYDDAVLHPQAGVTGQLESGFRGKHFSVSAFCEVMRWAQSDEVWRWDYDNQNGYTQYSILQPASILLTVGMRAAFSF